MRSATACLAVAGFVALSGCAPVYIFVRRAEPSIEVEAARVRLRALLDAEGFQSVGSSDEMAGDIGCGQDAADRRAFRKGWHDWLAYYRILVHEFTCDGGWYVVILSSKNANSEERNVRDAITKVFDGEIASGVLQVHTTYRIPLE